MIHLIGLAVCVAVVAVSKVSLKRERESLETVERLKKGLRDDTARNLDTRLN
jgi:hypothetical protein